jgi:hypothetical protein
MATIPAKLLEIRANVQPARSEWIAASSSESPLRVAVIGASEQEARDLFERELEAWVLLFEQASHDEDPAEGQS